VEVLLRVRQAANPTFNFLLPGNINYPYYRWIVEANPKVPAVTANQWRLQQLWSCSSLHGCHSAHLFFAAYLYQKCLVRACSQEDQCQTKVTLLSSCVPAPDRIHLVLHTGRTFTGRTFTGRHSLNVHSLDAHSLDVHSLHTGRHPLGVAHWTHTTHTVHADSTCFLPKSLHP